MNSWSPISRSIPDTARVPSGYFLPTPSNVTLAIHSPFLGQREEPPRGSKAYAPSPVMACPVRPVAMRRVALRLALM